MKIVIATSMITAINWLYIKKHFQASYSNSIRKFLRREVTLITLFHTSNLSVCMESLHFQGNFWKIPSKCKKSSTNELRKLKFGQNVEKNNITIVTQGIFNIFKKFKMAAILLPKISQNYYFSQKCLPFWKFWKYQKSPL